jgi:hypothetical protein
VCTWVRGRTSTLEHVSGVSNHNPVNVHMVDGGEETALELERVLVCNRAQVHAWCVRATTQRDRCEPMATLTYADMIASYPELTTTDADTLTRIAHFLDIAEQVVSSDAFGTTAKRDRCRLAVAAHLTSLANRDACASSSGARAGAVTGRTRGSRSVSYATPSLASRPTGMQLGSTRYGQLALMMLTGARHRRGVVS